MTDRTVAAYHDPKLTGVGAMERYAHQERRELKQLPDGEFRFVDGFKVYKPVMVAGGWQIIVVREA